MALRISVFSRTNYLKLDLIRIALLYKFSQKLDFGMFFKLWVVSVPVNIIFRDNCTFGI